MPGAEPKAVVSSFRARCGAVSRLNLLASLAACALVCAPRPLRSQVKPVPGGSTWFWY